MARHPIFAQFCFVACSLISMKQFQKLLFALAWLGCSLPTGLWAQSDVANRMKEHIVFLASDALEGRETGHPGEAKASEYIQAQFKAIGLQPKGLDGSYEQPFKFMNRLMPTDNVALKVNGKALILGHDFQIFPQSGDGTISGMPIKVGFGIQAPQLGHDDYKDKGDLKGKLVLIERGTPDGNDPHGKFADYAAIDLKVETALKMGVGGIIFINPSNQDLEEPVIDYSRKVARGQLPIIYLVTGVTKGNDIKEVQGTIGLHEENLTGHNVVGLLDYGQPYTIVIGAHYDHLGYGDEGSLHRGEKAIHNGADDNASGTAMVIELARTIKGNASLHKFNYLFMSFSGEEKGLLGSNYFAKNPTIDLSKVSCMINFDMVGRIDPAKNTLGINAVGTSPFWKEAMAGIQIDDMKVKTAESGVGPSDHTSFYLKDLPVLHFFSGTHSDYHKPSDDEALINYDGADKIFRYVDALLIKLNENGHKLAFTQTKNEEEGEAPRWKVSLGVVPDYLFDGEGMRIDGVTEGKPASRAKLLAGDVVVKMGDHEVKDMMSYMRALSKYEKGDTVTVVVLRNGKSKTKKVTF
jgi:aminopeptidase YwaD